LRFDLNTKLPRRAVPQRFSHARTIIATIPTSMPRSMKKRGHNQSLSSYLSLNTRAQICAAGQRGGNQAMQQ